MRVSRKGIKLSGSGLADILAAVAPRLPIRDLDTLSRQYGGMTGAALAGQVIRTASHTSAAVGGVSGAIASAGAFAPPFWLMFPAELITETLLISSVEMKLVAELHNVYERPIEGGAATRGMAILEAWAERRGVRVEDLASTGGLGQQLSKGARNQIVQMVRRRLLGRLARNVSTLAPLFVGAVAGAEINRRATRDLGDAIVRDLASRPPTVRTDASSRWLRRN